MNKREYSNHRDQFENASPTTDRVRELSDAIDEGFGRFIEKREIGVILFGQISAEELAQIFLNHPILVKSVLASINVASRAIARDLQFEFNAYKTKLTPVRAAAIAGYVKPILPKELPVPSLLELDRYFWTDKEMRAAKGNWEKRVNAFLISDSGIEFGKRNFCCGEEQFELDSAFPVTGDSIKVGVDVKRIESPRDIHKRSDEIINKSAKFKKSFPEGFFAAVLYYPFPAEHHNLTNRLQSSSIDGIFFAAETDSSVQAAVKMLLAKFNLLLDAED